MHTGRTTLDESVKELDANETAFLLAKAVIEKRLVNRAGMPAGLATASVDHALSKANANSSLQDRIKTVATR